jgi:hypothetical protein
MPWSEPFHCAEVNNENSLAHSAYREKLWRQRQQLLAQWDVSWHITDGKDAQALRSKGLAAHVAVVQCH